MQTQHEPGTRDRIVKPPRLRKPELAYALTARLGKAHAGELVLVTSLDEFFQEYLPSMEVEGTTIRFSKQCPPTPRHIAERLLQQPGSRFAELLAFRNWVEGATDAELLAAAQRLRKQLPAPKK